MAIAANSSFVNFSRIFTVSPSGSFISGISVSYMAICASGVSGDMLFRLLSCTPSAILIHMKATHAMIVPIMMKGVLLPRDDFDLSDREPKRGSIKSASILSSAIIAPESVWLIPNLSVSIFGTIVS